MAEASERMLLLTVRPEELQQASEALGGSRHVQRMGDDGFRRFHLETTRKAADAVLRRRLAEAEVERAPGQVVVRIIKRYQLKFFQEEVPDLPWLPLLQSLFLMVQGHAQCRHNGNTTSSKRSCESST